MDGTHVAKGEQRQQWPTGEHFSTSAHYRKVVFQVSCRSALKKRQCMVATREMAKWGNAEADRPYLLSSSD